KHHTPQTFVGDDAYENADPAIFLQRQAFMTKELAETIRRTSRDSAAGVLHFAYFTWLKKVWDVNGMNPLPPYDAIQVALQPVLVSAELFGRHFYFGRELRRRVCIINDAESFQALPASKLRWEFRSGNKTLSHGEMEVPPVNYYENRWLDVDFSTPKNLPTPRVDGQLVLKLEAGGKVFSENNYDVVIATDAWTKGHESQSGRTLLLSSTDSSEKILSAVKMTTIASFEAAKSNDVVIIGDAKKIAASSSEIEKLKSFVSEGGRVLLLNPQSALTHIFPEQITNYAPRKGEIVTMRVPESPVFAGIAPLDLAWFERGGRQVPLACTGVYQFTTTSNITALAQQIEPHAYLQNSTEITKYSGSPLMEISMGKGRLIASEMNFESGKNDPIAQRLLQNIIHYLNAVPF
ncbi:MAG: hypothetical protein ABJC04_07120, partial [Verrucomicrobiota bacterium]